MQKYTTQKVSRSLGDKEAGNMLRVLLQPSLGRSKRIELDYHLFILISVLYFKGASRVVGKEAEAKWFK